MFARMMLTVVFGYASLWAGADMLSLKNGDRITGTVDSVSGGALTIKTEYAGSITVSLDAIDRADTAKEFDLKLKSGSEISGRLVASETGQQVDTGAETATLELDDILYLTEDLTALAGLTRDWSSRADVNAAISQGNSETDSYAAIVESILKLENQEHRVALVLSKEEADGVTTKEQFEFDYGYKWFYTDDWFLSGNTEYFKDKLKGIDRRVTLGLGVGHQFWDNTLGALSAELGVSEVFEDLEGGSANNPAVRWALTYNRLLWSKRLELFHKHQILKILDSDRGEVINASTGLRFILNDTWNANIRYDLDYETEPPPGNEKTDATVAVGLGMKF